MRPFLVCAALIAAAIGSITGFRAQAPADSPAALKPTGGRGLTEVPGIKVGSHTLTERLTGCTVILVDGDGVPGGVSQRGGAPGTSETDLLHPLNMVDRVNAVVLAGGSAYGLDARARRHEVSRGAQDRLEGLDRRGPDRPERDPHRPRVRRQAARATDRRVRLQRGIHRVDRAGRRGQRRRRSGGDCRQDGRRRPFHERGPRVRGHHPPQRPRRRRDRRGQCRRRHRSIPRRAR